MSSMQGNPGPGSDRPTMSGGGPPKVRQQNHSAMHKAAGMTRFAGLPREELMKKSNRAALTTHMPHYGVFVTQIWPPIHRALQARTVSDTMPFARVPCL